MFFSTDATGYYQLSYLDVETSAVKVLKLAAGLEEASIGTTEWQFGNHSYVFLSEKTAIAAALVEGASKLITIDLRSGDWQDLNLPLTSVGFNNLVAASETAFIVIGATDTEPGALYSVDVRAESTMHKLKPTLDIALSKDNISIATSITCPTAHNLITHAFFYPPKNALFRGPPAATPPVIVMAHGGPTGVSARSFNTQTQYWTTRGYAYVLLNYRCVCLLLPAHLISTPALTDNTLQRLHLFRPFLHLPTQRNMGHRRRRGRRSHRLPPRLPRSRRSNPRRNHRRQCRRLHNSASCMRLRSLARRPQPFRDLRPARPAGRDA